MEQRGTTGRSYGRGYVALSVMAAGLASLVSPTFASRLVNLDLADSTAETIESMRAEMSVSFLEAALLQATVSRSMADDDSDTEGGSQGACSVPGEEGCSWPTYSITDVHGVVHTCSVREETPGKPSASRRRWGGKHVAAALDSLEGRCATLHQEYWSFTWCHKEKITQYHKHSDGTKTTLLLGKHTRTEVKRVDATTSKADPANGSSPKAAEADARPASGGKGSDKKGDKEGDGVDGADGVGRSSVDGDDGADEGSWTSRVRKMLKGKKSDPYDGITDFSEVAAVFDYYEEGDTCEETGEHRRTVTSITCCATKVEEADGLATLPIALLVSIQEVSVCSYLVQVCSQLLCPDLAEEHEHDYEHGNESVPRRSLVIWGSSGAKGGAALSAGTATTGGVLGILEELEACFPVKNDTWWTYRLCFSSGISQFHMDMVAKSEGEYARVITNIHCFRHRNFAEYSLGKFDRSSVAGRGDELIRKGEEGEDSAIVLEFTGGTECDLTGVLRSTTVFLKCGSMEKVEDVVEDSTCHYRMVAISPLLCSHPELAGGFETKAGRSMPASDVERCNISGSKVKRIEEVNPGVAPRGNLFS